MYSDKGNDIYEIDTAADTNNSVNAADSTDSIINCLDKSLDWSNNTQNNDTKVSINNEDCIANNFIPENNMDNTIILKRNRYESMQTEIFEYSQIIKKLKKSDEEKQKIIKQYEEVIDKENKKGICNSRVLGDTFNRQIISSSQSDNVLSLLASADRYKCHIKALKRDLLIAEDKINKCDEDTRNIVSFWKKEYEKIKDDNISYKNKIKELEIENRAIKMEFDKKCEEILELIVYCRYLNK